MNRIFGNGENTTKVDFTISKYVIPSCTTNPHFGYHFFSYVCTSMRILLKIENDNFENKVNKLTILENATTAIPSSITGDFIYPLLPVQI